MIRRRPLYLSILLATTALLSACNDNNSIASSGTASTSSTTAAESGATATTGAGSSTSAKSAASAASGSGACAALTNEELATYLTDTQLLAQVNSPEQVATLKTGSFGNYTPDSLAAILTKMHAALDGHPVASFGDPKDSIAFYERLNDSVRAMFAAAPPVPKQMIDDYVSLSGGVQGVIGKQLAINAALSETCHA